MELGESKELGQIIGALQAAQIAQATMLQAMISSHPNPSALRQRWAELVPPRAAEAVQEKASGAPGHFTNHFLLEAFQDWTGYLEKFARHG